MMDETPTVGAVVVTADGEELGRVKEFEGDCFKIDRSLMPDFWIAPDAIDVATPETVQLLFTKTDIPAVFEPSAEHSGYHIH